MKYIAILGRQHELALAELETLYGPESLEPINKHACFINKPVEFERLGSTIKITRFIQTLESQSIAQAIESVLPHILESRRERTGKLQLGLSTYGTRVTASQINRAALDLKRKLRSEGVSLRLVPNKAPELNAAQILNNKLTRENGFELNLIVDGNKTHLTQTLQVQDIDEYARRDRDKPVRDPLVGMLPPKLAQTLINLSGANPNQTILDPFCGTGTVLMEAFAMGINSYGSDISPEMIEATRLNMDWFAKNQQQPSYNVKLADATSHQWETNIDAVAGETFLGPALRKIPEKHALKTIIHDVDDIHRRFLLNLAPQLTSGVRVCLAVPSWHDSGVFIDLPCLDDLEKLGYNPSSFVFTHNKLVYHRPQQVVGRRILNLVRK